MILSILSWVAIGLLVGFVTGKLIDLHGDDPRFGMAAAAIGAVVAGVLYILISGSDGSVWHAWSLLWGLVGAVVSVIAWHLVRSRFVSRAAYVPRSSY